MRKHKPFLLNRPLVQYRHTKPDGDLKNCEHWGGIPGETDRDIIKYLDDGHIKQAVSLLRSRDIIKNPDLIKKICDHLDPEIPKKRGAPKTDYDIRRQKYLRTMIICYIIRRYAYKKKRGDKNPGTLAKGDVMEKFDCGDTLFDQAHKKYSSTMKLEYIEEMIRNESYQYEDRFFFDDDLDDDRSDLIERKKLYEWAGNIS